MTDAVRRRILERSCEEGWVDGVSRIGVAISSLVGEGAGPDKAGVVPAGLDLGDSEEGVRSVKRSENK